MLLKVLLINSVLGALIQMITCIAAAPTAAIHMDGKRERAKKIDYSVDMPLQTIEKESKSSEYDYGSEYPLKAKAKVSYSVDFTVPLPPKVKRLLFDRNNRKAAHKKDFFKTDEVSKTCGCHRCANANRNVLRQSSAAPYTQNIRHPNSVDGMTPSSSSQIVAIFLKPLKQTYLERAKSRNKRDLSRIFMRPHKNKKRSDRLVKQYRKHIKDAAIEKASVDDRFKSKTATVLTNKIRPLEHLSRLLTLPRLRNKRDIKGEYDLIEEERGQMDFTLPEITQYMPETLNPNFNRNRCLFVQSLQHTDLTETSTKATTTTTTSETPTTSATTKSITNANNIKGEEVPKKIDKSTSSMNTKRFAGNYKCRCPLAGKSYHPTASPDFTSKSLSKKPHGIDLLAKQFAKASRNLLTSSADISKLSNRREALKDPLQVPKPRSEYRLQSLRVGAWNDYFSEDNQNLPYLKAPLL